MKSDKLQEMYDTIFAPIVTQKTRINKIQIVPIIYDSTHDQFKILTKIKNTGANDRMIESIDAYSTFDTKIPGKNLFNILANLFTDILIKVPSVRYVVDINIDPKTNTVTLYYFLTKLDEKHIDQCPYHHWLSVENIPRHASPELMSIKENIDKAVALCKIRQLHNKSWMSRKKL